MRKREREKLQDGEIEKVRIRGSKNRGSEKYFVFYPVLHNATSKMKDLEHNSK